VAEAKLKAIAAAIQGLLKHPCLYRRSEHGGRREMIVRGHLVVYRLRPDTGSNQTAGDVEVLRVFGPGQDVVV